MLFTFKYIIILGSRLFYLQIYRHEELKEKAEKQQRREINLAKKRGLITDRNGSIIAIDTEAISVYAYPKEYKLDKHSITEMAEKIAPIINEKPDRQK